MLTDVAIVKVNGRPVKNVCDLYNITYKNGHNATDTLNKIWQQHAYDLQNTAGKSYQVVLKKYKASKHTNNFPTYKITIKNILKQMEAF